MERPFVRLTLIAVAAVALAGCATFTDADVAARVGDHELSSEQLASVARERLGDEEADRVDAVLITAVLNDWVLDRVLRSDLEANGTPVDEISGELTNEALVESVRNVFGVWQQTPATPIADEDLRAVYELGPVESNIACTSHVLVADEDTANEVLDRLESGDDFAALATEYSTDTGSAANGGVLPCSSTSDFLNTYIPEYVGAALDAEIGEPVGPVESQFGFHVILVRPYDDVDADELLGVLSSPQLRFDFASREQDVYIDPRYGAFEASRGVVPLG